MAKIESSVEFDKDANYDKMVKRIVNNQQYTFRIPENLYRAVKLKLVKENRKLCPMLIEILEQYIKK